jgi:hypothetical protein
MRLIDTARSIAHRRQPATTQPQQLELAAAAMLPAA